MRPLIIIAIKLFYCDGRAQYRIDEICPLIAATKISFMNEMANLSEGGIEEKNTAICEVSSDTITQFQKVIATAITKFELT